MPASENLHKSGSLIDFATARALRIFPGLSVCVLLTALVIGPIVSNADAWTYFTSSALPSYIVKTLLSTPERKCSRRPEQKCSS